jgi:hypothetical protein
MVCAIAEQSRGKRRGVVCKVETESFDKLDEGLIVVPILDDTGSLLSKGSGLVLLAGVAQDLEHPEAGANTAGIPEGDDKLVSFVAQRRYDLGRRWLGRDFIARFAFASRGGFTGRSRGSGRATRASRGPRGFAAWALFDFTHGEF